MFPIQTPLDALPDLGMQPHLKAPRNLGNKLEIKK